jgi:hypothetical protein
MTWVSWEKFMTGRAPASLPCLGASWRDWPKQTGGPSPTPGAKLKKWLATNCSGHWSMKKLPRVNACVVAFEDDADHARARALLVPNVPFVAVDFPACTAGFEVVIDGAVYQRL